MAVINLLTCSSKVCTVTKELCVNTPCSSCRDILYNRTNHLWAFLSHLSHLFRICNVKFQHLQTFLVFICIFFESYPNYQTKCNQRRNTRPTFNLFFFSNRKPILDMQGLCFLVKFSYRKHVVWLIK